MFTYFAKDGSYGDAADMVILDTSDWDEADWAWIDSQSDSGRYGYALAVAHVDNDDDND